MDSLLDLLKTQITPELVQKASSLSGEDATKTTAALGAIGPTILSAIANKGSTASGATQILGALTEHKVDDGLMGNLMGMLGNGDSTSSLLKMGGALLPSLLGGNSSGIASMIASLVGVKSGSATMLMSLAAPLIGSLLSKQVKTGGLDASGLASMLTGQKSLLAAAAPKGLDALLGMGDVASNVTSAAKGAMDAGASTVRNVAGSAANAANVAANAGANVTRSAVNTASAVADTAKAGGNSMMKWLLPLLAVLVVGFLAWRLLGGSGVPDLKAVACTQIGNVEQTINTGIPAIGADTKVADVKTWLSKVKPALDTLVTAGKAAGIATDGLTTAYTALETAINGVTGDTLGAASGAINTAINSFKTVESGLKTTVGCK